MTTTKPITLHRVKALEAAAKRLRVRADEMEVAAKVVESNAWKKEREARDARSTYERELVAAELAAAYAKHPKAQRKNLPKSVTVFDQTKSWEKISGDSKLVAVVRFDDRLKNGHNTFSITGTLYERRGKGWGHEMGGCIHETIAEWFPELAPVIKWHLVSTDGPMHYLGNTAYHVEQGNLAYARSSASWPDATDEDLTAPGLQERLIARLPELMLDFQAAVTGLGFTY